MNGQKFKGTPPGTTTSVQYFYPELPCYVIRKRSVYIHSNSTWVESASKRTCVMFDTNGANRDELKVWINECLAVRGLEGTRGYIVTGTRNKYKIRNQWNLDARMVSIHSYRSPYLSMKKVLVISRRTIYS